VSVPAPATKWRFPARVGGALSPVIEAVAAMPANRPPGTGLAVRLGPGVAARLGAGDGPGGEHRVAVHLARRLGVAEPHLHVGEAADPFERPWPLGDDVRPRAVDDARLPERPTLFVVAAGLEPARWRARPATIDGSCDPLLASLGRGQALGLASLEPYFVGADERLQRRYRAIISADWSEHRSRLERVAAAARAASQSTCADEVDELRAALDRCVKGGGCRSAPRLFLGAHLYVGSRNIGDDALGGCAPRSEDPDLAQTLTALRGAAQAASSSVAETLDPRWTEFADRLSALVAVYEHVERMCEPRRRRFTERDVAELDASLDSLVERLRAPLVGARTHWRGGARAFHVAGLGKVQPWLVADGPTAASVRSEAASLESEVYDRARCTGPFEDDPLALVLVAEGEVLDAYFVYPEQLVCPQLEGD